MRSSASAVRRCRTASRVSSSVRASCESDVEFVIHDVGGCRALSADRSPSTLSPGVQDVKDRFELSSVRRGITAMCPSLRFVR